MLLLNRLLFGPSICAFSRLLLTFLPLVSDGEDNNRLHPLCCRLQRRMFSLWERRKEPFRMAKRIYVGGLPYSTVEEDLENLFKASGTVTSVAVITDKYTGQSKGFGFVEMSSDAEAQAAINTLNGTMMG